ncbi:hypothetical protein FM038_020920 [Shewanella eurypsychrophilus]|uniref:DUF3244 domain-containing protein n=2 Tax=Shewanella TaxID=22 RepID=A0ABX6VAM1_9GAMM|nr:hypothetical protein [Shewanella eurypsychrophilus]QPG59568.2 hypothetical protein FM038_020920 [Shewanella eurypsychrophilus]
MRIVSGSALFSLSGALCVGMLALKGYAHEASHDMETGQIISSHVELLMRKSAGTMIEKCVEIPSLYRVSFNYTSAEVTLFSVHYHQGEEVLLAFDEDEQSSLSSHFNTQSDQTYCFTWVNEQEQRRDWVISLEYKAAPL